METALKDLSPLDQGVLACLDSIVGRAKQCAKSALVHLEKAERLVGLDSEMACFRAITAEEEAATALFFAVKQQRYANADRLNHRSHVHKNALLPFLLAINNYISSCTPPPPPTRLVVETENGKKRLTIKLQMPAGSWAEPVPPLHFSITGEAAGRRARFGEDLEKLAAADGKADVQKFLKAASNLRNELLYASEAGVPVVGGDVQAVLKKARWRVFILLRAVCLIAPYKEHALFVQQALDALLIAVRAIKEEDLAW